jgi:hypothetical protein
LRRARQRWKGLVGKRREGAKMTFDMDKTTDETFGRKEERKVMPFCCISMSAESIDKYP